MTGRFKEIMESITNSWEDKPEGFEARSIANSTIDTLARDIARDYKKQPLCDSASFARWEPLHNPSIRHHPTDTLYQFPWIQFCCGTVNVDTEDVTCCPCHCLVDHRFMHKDVAEYDHAIAVGKLKNETAKLIREAYDAQAPDTYQEFWPHLLNSPQWAVIKRKFIAWPFFTMRCLGCKMT